LDWNECSIILFWSPVLIKKVYLKENGFLTKCVFQINTVTTVDRNYAAARNLLGQSLHTIQVCRNFTVTNLVCINFTITSLVCINFYNCKSCLHEFLHSQILFTEIIQSHIHLQNFFSHKHPLPEIFRVKYSFLQSRIFFTEILQSQTFSYKNFTAINVLTEVLQS
jgi:hypothetical protein